MAQIYQAIQAAVPSIVKEWWTPIAGIVESGKAVYTNKNSLIDDYQIKEMLSLYLRTHKSSKNVFLWIHLFESGFSLNFLLKMMNKLHVNKTDLYSEDDGSILDIVLDKYIANILLELDTRTSENRIFRDFMIEFFKNLIFMYI